MWLDVGMNLVRNDKSDRHMKFVIVSPRQRGGGAVVLHTLCYLLNQLGQDAILFRAESKMAEEEKSYVPLANCVHLLRHSDVKTSSTGWRRETSA